MPLRVLVVDDNAIARALLGEMLENIGHTMVAEAENMAEALKTYQEHKPDLVTLDLSLTNENGIEVLKALRKLDSAAKILIVTSNAQKKIHDEVLAAGATGFLGKPFDRKDLITTLAAYQPK